jgi:AraC-like DNA-binding protein
MDRRIQIVISKIESNPAVEFSELAALVNLSESRLRHLFKKETGTTYKHHVRDLRLHRAEVMLRKSFLSVKEIASRVGLTSMSHFVRDFKKEYGVSPTVFRLRNGAAGNRGRSKKKTP